MSNSSPPLSQAIEETRNAFSEALKQATNLEQLELVRIQFLGRNGTLIELTKQIKELSIEEKRVHAPKIQELKQWATSAHEQAVQRVQRSATQADQEKHKQFDVTAYKPEAVQGGLHVYTRIVEDLTNILISMGYTMVDGPEVEQDYYNFEALNIPADHPARDMQDTFWLTLPSMLLRTHTSSVQMHAIETEGAPLAVFTPGRVYRHEQTDASHDYVFMQVEGLLIDTDISMSNLLATAKQFLNAIFERDDLKIRVRPGYFPFVEPGVEIDASCPFCSAGCSVCKQTTWIELLGAGLVHPNVLRAGKIDTEKYSGFAFGIGIERLAMLKYGIDDIRHFHSDKLGFLKQF